jgi:hypothetical protein
LHTDARIRVGVLQAHQVHAVSIAPAACAGIGGNAETCREARSLLSRVV